MSLISHHRLAAAKIHASGHSDEFRTCPGNTLVDAPFRRIPVFYGSGLWMKGALNPISSITDKFWKSNSRVLVYFTKEVLAINELQRAAPEIRKDQSSGFEFFLLRFCDCPYDVGFTKAMGIRKTL